MKSTLLMVTIMLASLAHAGNDVELDQRWLTDKLRTPESVLYYHQDDHGFLLVSEIEGNPTDADGQGGIAKLGLDGEIIEPDWVRGLNAPKGMGYFEDKLYVADINEIVVISLSEAEVLYKVSVPDSIFLNDVAVNAHGEVFVSDTRTNKVHRLAGKKVSTYLTQVNEANGLTVVDGELIVGAGQELLAFDSDKDSRVLADGFESQIDGIEKVGPNEFLVSCWVGLLYHVDAEGKLQKLIDSRDQEVNTADIGYNPKDKTVYIPNFFSDSVTAYKVEKAR